MNAQPHSFDTKYYDLGDGYRLSRAENREFTNVFHELGFSQSECRHWMIRPTSEMDATFSPEWELISLTSDLAPRIADLLYQAFTGGVGQYGKKDLAAHRNSVDQFFEKLSSEKLLELPSIGLTNRQSGDLAAVIMVDLHKGIPSIRFVAVLPEFQRFGLGANLIKYVINRLVLNYDYVKLAVTIGNPAIHAYKKLGFIPGDVVCEFLKGPITPQKSGAYPSE